MGKCIRCGKFNSLDVDHIIKTICFLLSAIVLFSFCVAYAESPVFPPNLYADLCEHPERYLSKPAVLYGKTESFFRSSSGDALLLLSLSDDLPDSYVQVYLEAEHVPDFSIENGTLLKVNSLFIGNMEQHFLPDISALIPNAIAESVLQLEFLPPSTLPADFYGLSFDQLISLENRLSLAIEEIAQWQEVTLRPGLWKIGKDIPAGHYTLRTMSDRSTRFAYGSSLDESALQVSPSSSDYVYDSIEGSSSVDLQLHDGAYLDVLDHLIYVSPYTGTN